MADISSKPPSNGAATPQIVLEGSYSSSGSIPDKSKIIE